MQIEPQTIRDYDTTAAVFELVLTVVGTSHYLRFICPSRTFCVEDAAVWRPTFPNTAVSRLSMGLTQQEQTPSNSALPSNAVVVHIVDRDSGVMHCIQALVEPLGVDVSCHRSAEEFLKSADFGRPGCVITEVHLPGISGIDLQQILQQRGIAYPAIVMASHADVRMAVRAMALGALDFIEKPFVDRLLLARVKQAVRSATRLNSCTTSQRTKVGSQAPHVT